MQVHKSGLWAIDFMRLVVKDGAQLPDVCLDPVMLTSSSQRLKITLIQNHSKLTLGIAATYLIISALSAYLLEAAYLWHLLFFFGVAFFWLIEIFRASRSKVKIDAVRLKWNKFLLPRPISIICLLLIFSQLDFSDWKSTVSLSHPAYLIWFAVMIAAGFIRKPLSYKKRKDSWLELNLPIEVIQDLRRYRSQHIEDFLRTDDL